MKREIETKICFVLIEKLYFRQNYYQKSSFQGSKWCHIIWVNHYLELMTCTVQNISVMSVVELNLQHWNNVLPIEMPDLKMLQRVVLEGNDE